MPTTREYSATAYMNTKNRTSLSGKMETRYAYCYVLGVYGYFTMRTSNKPSDGRIKYNTAYDRHLMREDSLWMQRTLNMVTEDPMIRIRQLSPWS